MFFCFLDVGALEVPPAALASGTSTVSVMGVVIFILTDCVLLVGFNSRGKGNWAANIGVFAWGTTEMGG